MIVAPRNGMIIINPATGKALPAEGADVEFDTYWFRRQQDGDIEVIGAEQQSVAAQAETQKRSNKKRTDEGK